MSSLSCHSICFIKMLLSLVLILAAVEVVVVSAARLPSYALADPDQENQPSLIEKSLNREIHSEMQRQFLILRAAEENILEKLRELGKERERLVSQGVHGLTGSINNKRTDKSYSTPCLFNVVACYRKRK